MQSRKGEDALTAAATLNDVLDLIILLNARTMNIIDDRSFEKNRWASNYNLIGYIEWSHINKSMIDFY